MGTMVRRCAAGKAIHVGLAPTEASTCKAEGTRPCVVRKGEWEPLAKKVLQNRQVILHTDSAKSYKTAAPGVLHDRVVRKKQRVKAGNTFRWLAPKYVELKSHKLPGLKKILKVKSGTQIIDRCWRLLKERLHVNQNSRVGSRTLKMQLLSAQYEYWIVLA